MIVLNKIHLYEKKCISLGPSIKRVLNVNNLIHVGVTGLNIYLLLSIIIEE